MRVDEDHKRPGNGLSVAIADGLGDGGHDLVQVSYNHTRPPPNTEDWYQDRPADEHEAVEQDISGPVDEQFVVDRRVLDVLGIESRKHAQAPVNPAALGPVEEPEQQSVHHVRRHVIAVSQRRNFGSQQLALPLSADGQKKRGSTGPTGTKGSCRQAPARAVGGTDGTPRGVGGAKVVTVAVDVGSLSRLPVPRNRLGGGSTRRRGGRLRALTFAAVWPEGWRGGMHGGAAGGGEELGRWEGGGARCAAAGHWPLHPWEASACWTRNPAGAVSAESGTPPRSPFKILTAEPNRKSIASTSLHPPRHCLSICSRTGLGRNSGPASYRADRRIRSCEAVSPPDRLANTRRASLTTEMASDAGRDPSQPDGAPSGRTRVHSTLGPRAPSRPDPLIARGGWRSPNEWDAVSVIAPCPYPPPSACPCSRDGPKFRAGGCSPPPRPLALPWPRPRPRPPRPALPRLIPSGIVGAGGGTMSARRASATAPRSAACAASTARAASTAARAASAVMASARRRARATWRRWL